jgi:hypothetical protein
VEQNRGPGYESMSITNNGEKATSLTNVVGKGGYLPEEDWK